MFSTFFGKGKFTFKEAVIDWETVKKHNASEIVIFRAIPNKVKKKDAEPKKNSYYLLTEMRTKQVLKNQHTCPKTANDRIKLATINDLNKQQLSLFTDSNDKNQLKDTDELEMIENNQQSLNILNSIPWTPEIDLNKNDNKNTDYNKIAIDTMTAIRGDIKNKNFEMLGSGEHYINKAEDHDQHVPKGMKYTLEKFDELAKKSPNINSDDIDKTYKKLHRRLVPKCDSSWKRYKSTAKRYKTIIKKVSAITSPLAIWQSQQMNKKIDLTSPTSTPEPLTPRSHTAVINHSVFVMQ
ncbi:MAG: hypothetical protein GY821_10500 [Gammaproteobacteria bacterium]|nr:hypothetical protein [Gammaproteobacteria bacterium]